MSTCLFTSDMVPSQCATTISFYPAPILPNPRRAGYAREVVSLAKRPPNGARVNHPYLLFFPFSLHYFANTSRILPITSRLICPSPSLTLPYPIPDMPYNIPHSVILVVFGGRDVPSLLFTLCSNFFFFFSLVKHDARPPILPKSRSIGMSRAYEGCMRGVLGHMRDVGGRARGGGLWRDGPCRGGSTSRMDWWWRGGAR